MDSVDLADAKLRFSELIERASAGETIQILRYGEPVAALTPPARPRRAITAAFLKSISDPLGHGRQSTAEFSASLRDGDRY
jgi:prevent-host-death family protein